MGAAPEKKRWHPSLCWNLRGKTPWPTGFRRGRGTSENRKVTENINPTEVEQLSANRRPKSKGLQTAEH